MIILELRIRIITAATVPISTVLVRTKAVPATIKALVEASRDLVPMHTAKLTRAMSIILELKATAITNSNRVGGISNRKAKATPDPIGNLAAIALRMWLTVVAPVFLIPLDPPLLSIEIVTMTNHMAVANQADTVVNF